MQMLNIVDENDNIIGEETREKIHKDGLLHREIHIWIYNDQGDILFQKRAEGKDTNPGLLDASVGGHVEIGESYEQAAIKELEEETGLKAHASDLTFIDKARRKNFDIRTGTTNHAVRSVYAYRYNGHARDLRVEEGKAAGFEFWPIDKIMSLPESERHKFIPAIFGEDFSEIFRQIKELV